MRGGGGGGGGGWQWVHVLMTARVYIRMHTPLKLMGWAAGWAVQPWSATVSLSNAVDPLAKSPLLLFERLLH